jgi:hypothetical protein
MAFFITIKPTPNHTTAIAAVMMSAMMMVFRSLIDRVLSLVLTAFSAKRF